MSRRNRKRPVMNSRHGRNLLEALEPRTLFSAIYQATMDTNPSWSLDTVSGVGWSWGTPAGAGGDPSSGHTGTRVIGTILASPGTYPVGIAVPPFYAKTPVINCTDYKGVTLSFWRWLRAEAGDVARVQVSNNNSTWTTLFTNASGTYDTSWVQQAYDISAIADDQSTVYIRWSLSSDGDSSVYGGWNLDDVVVSGTYDPTPPNDLFANAEPIDTTDLVAGFTDVWKVTGTNVDATKEVGEPNHYSAGGKSIWYRWVAPATKTFEVNTKGSNFDTLLAVYSGTGLSNLQSIAADDESGGSHTSKVTFSTVAGTTYWIAVDGYAAASGQVTLNVTTNHSPTDIQLSSNRVLEGANAIGNLSTVDPDVGDSFTYALVPGAGDSDNALLRISSTQLYLPVAASYPAKQSYSVRIRATDSSGATLEKAFQINVVRPVEFDERAHWGGTVSAVTTSGTRAFINKGKDLIILNIATPANPLETGRLTMSDGVHDIAVVGNIAYVTAGKSLEILDVSGAAPVRLGAYAMPDQAHGVCVVGTVAYVAADWTGSLQIIDVSNPAQPKFLGTYGTSGTYGALGYAQDVAVVNGIAYVVASDPQNGGSSLHIIDVVRPEATARLGGYTLGGYSATAVSVSGSIACVANGNSFRLMDVSSPAAPVPRGSYGTMGGLASGVALAGNLAYVAFGGKGLEIVDISNPAAPVRRGGYDTTGSACAVSVAGSVAYVADSDNGLQVIGVSNPASPVRLGAYGRGGNVTSVSVVGNRAYVASYAGALEILDVSNPSAPALLGSWDGLSDAEGVSVAGNIACVADRSSGLQIFDVSNPASPTRVGNYIHSGAAVTAVQMVGNRAYLISYGGIEVVDLSNPALPVLLGSSNTAGIIPYDLSVVGTIVYVADYDGGLAIIDFSNPASPVGLGVYDPGGDIEAWGVGVVGTTAYLGCDLDGLQIVDVSNPAAPVLLGTADFFGYARQITAVGNLAHVAGGYSGYRVVDVSDPAQPMVLGAYAYYEALGIGCVAVSGDYAYVTDSSNGMDILRLCRAPVDLGLSAAAAAENQPANTTVGTLSASDPNVVESFSYSLVPGAGATDNGSFVIVGNTLRTNAVFDYETRNSYSVRIRVTDSDGLWYEEPWTISITNANDAPTGIALSPASVAENAAVGTTVGMLSATDQDASESFAYALVSGTGSADNASFTISGNTLKTAASFNFEAKSSYSIRVRVTDKAGLTYEKVLTVSVTDVDEVPPTVVSIARHGNSPTNSDMVMWDVVFSESVTGVDASDFAVSCTGSATYGLLSVSGLGTNWLITLDYVSGEGSLTPRLDDNDTIHDSVGNRLGGTGPGNGNMTGETTAIDSVSPSVVSIVPGGTLNPSVYGFYVTFSEAITGVDVSDFAATFTGTATGTITGVIESGDPFYYTVIISSASGDGTVQLDLVDDDTIADSLGNRLGGTGTGNGNFTGGSRTIDHTPPTVASITRSTASPTNSDIVKWDVVFTESVTGVDASDFSVSCTGSASYGLLSVSGLGTNWLITLDYVSGGGTLTPRLDDNDTVMDSVGNRLGGTGVGNGDAVGQSTELDQVGPTVTSIVPLGGTNPDVRGFTVTFSEEVTGVDTTDFWTVFDGTASGEVTSVLGSGNTYTVIMLVSGEGDVRLDLLDDDSIADALGNKLAGTGTGNGNFIGGTSVIEHVAPVVHWISRVGPTLTNAATLEWNVRFSEAVTGVDAADFALTKLGSISTGALSVTGSGQDYLLTVSSVSGSGTLTPRLTDDDSIMDWTGNRLGGTGLGNGDSPGESITVEQTAPQITVASINGGAMQRSMVKALGVTFSEEVLLAPGAITVLRSTGQSVPNTTITLANPSGDQKTYLLTFGGTGTAGGSLADGIYDLVISANGVQDLAGNAMMANYTKRFHRLFGDADGNKVVNALDYAKLKATYGRSSADPLFNGVFDYEGNSVINALDLAQFRKRYGMSFSY